jgi:hypothetical protein
MKTGMMGVGERRTGKTGTVSSKGRNGTNIRKTKMPVQYYAATECCIGLIVPHRYISATVFLMKGRTDRVDG